jgi:hypothetical protein
METVWSIHRIPVLRMDHLPNSINYSFLRGGERPSPKRHIYEILLNHRRDYKVYRIVPIDFLIPSSFSVIGKNP